MNKSLIAAGIFSFAAFVQAGDITGKITLDGTPDPAGPLPIVKDSDCGKLHPNALPKTRLYVVDANKGLADTVIYLKDAGTGKTFPVPTEPVILDQINCEYFPYVIAVQAKQTILVKNSDPLMHNVHPVPAVKGNPESNKTQMQKGVGKDLVFTFDNAEPFLKFTCNVHSWMFAYAYIVDHPYFAVSGKDGSYTIKNVPPGKYTVEAHHRKAGKSSMEVTVADAPAKADFTLKVPAK